MQFADDLAFLRRYTPIVLLHDEDGSGQVAVAPGFQGRVMTSTAGDPQGKSFGFINRAFIAQQKRVPHMNVFGGEDRFWLGPEGGQFGLYFAPGAPFDLAHWQVPEAIDWGAWQVANQSAHELQVVKDIHVQNYAGTQFSLHVERAVRVLDHAGLVAALGGEPPAGVKLVGYATDNTIRNTGTAAWTKDTGLLSIWILGMFAPSPTTVIALPFRKGDAAELGPIVNDAYFGKIPEDRLRIGDGVLFFRGDGQARGKIGVPRPRALPYAGAYDTSEHVLTLVDMTIPQGATDYVNSMWETQQKPYAGDVINSYNDGPPEPGKPPLGPFYEIETSSPAAALAPGASLQHVHTTLHLIGPRDALDAVAQRVLHVSLAQIEAAFAPASAR